MVGKQERADLQQYKQIIFTVSISIFIVISVSVSVEQEGNIQTRGLIKILAKEHSPIVVVSSLFIVGLCSVVFYRTPETERI